MTLRALGKRSDRAVGGGCRPRKKLVSAEPATSGRSVYYPRRTLTRHLDSADWTDAGLIRTRPVKQTDARDSCRELSVRRRLGAIGDSLEGISADQTDI